MHPPIHACVFFFKSILKWLAECHLLKSGHLLFVILRIYTKELNNKSDYFQVVEKNLTSNVYKQVHFKHTIKGPN